MKLEMKIPLAPPVPPATYRLDRTGNFIVLFKTFKVLVLFFSSM